MKKLFEKFTDDVGPVILGVLWCVTLVGVSVGSAIWSIKWVLRLLGVI